MQPPEKTVATTDQFKTKDQKTLVSYLKGDAVKQRLAMGISKFVTPDRLASVALVAMNNDPTGKLARCTEESFLACLLKCAQFGIEPDGYHAHLIPYKETATLQWDYKGIALMCMRSGEISKLDGDVVCENDFFEYERGSNGHLIHRPMLRGERGEVYAVWSGAKMVKDGEWKFDVMRLDEVLRIRDKSQGYRGNPDKSPWTSDFDEMAKKTVFKRNSKTLPISPALKDSIRSDDQDSDEARFQNAKVVRPEFGKAIPAANLEPQESLPAPVIREAIAEPVKPEPEKVELKQVKEQSPSKSVVESVATPEAQSETVPVNATQEGSVDFDKEPYKALMGLCHRDKIKQFEVLEYCKANKLAKPTQAELAELATFKLTAICQAWSKVVESVNASRKVANE